MASRHLIFVYGTLKRGFCRAHFLTGQVFLGETRTRSIYRMYNCGTYPGLKQVGPGGLPITGELWDVDSECLQRLDREEGVHEQLYSRELIDLDATTPQGEPASVAEAYFYLPPVDGMPDCGSCWE